MAPGYSVEAGVLVCAGGEGRAGFVPWLLCGGQADGTGALQFVLQAPAKEWRLLADLARLAVLVVAVVGQTDHGVRLGQVAAEGGALCRLDGHTHGHTHTATFYMCFFFLSLHLTQCDFNLKKSYFHKLSNSLYFHKMTFWKQCIFFRLMRLQ